MSEKMAQIEDLDEGVCIETCENGDKIIRLHFATKLVPSLKERALREAALREAALREAAVRCRNAIDYWQRKLAAVEKALGAPSAPAAPHAVGEEFLATFTLPVHWVPTKHGGRSLESIEDCDAPETDVFACVGPTGRVSFLQGDTDPAKPTFPAPFPTVEDAMAAVERYFKAKEK